MKKIIKIISCIILATALAFGALCVYAANYSSEDDPLISLSYVNEVLLPQIKDMIYQVIRGEDISDILATTPAETTEASEITEEPTTAAPETTAEPEELFPEGTVNTGSKFAVINLLEGQTIFASVNSCEVIVRSGSTKVISPYTVKWEEQGVSDITDGKEIYNDEMVPNNHNIIIPRDDGRGIVALEGGSWVMVRGDYIIKSAVEEVSETTEETTEVEEPAEILVPEETSEPEEE